jgi:hypothetical protein
MKDRGHWADSGTSLRLASFEKIGAKPLKKNSLVFLTLDPEEQWSIMNRQYHSAKCSIPSWNKSWAIEDEQCQRIGGGYKAVKFRFLLFL